MGTIRFVLRTDKPLNNKTCPVDIIYQVAGQRKYFRTDLRLFPGSWDQDTQQVTYHYKKDKGKMKELFPDVNIDLILSQKDVKENNDTLASLITSIENIEKRFHLDKTPYSAEMVVEKLKLETKPKIIEAVDKDEVFNFMDNYIKENERVKVASSLAVYRSVNNHLKNFCKETGRKVTFQNIDYAFFQSFQNYLLKIDKDSSGRKIEGGLRNTSIAKQLSTVKTFLNYAKKQGFDVSMKYKDFTIKRQNLEVIALTNDEFERLFNMDLSSNIRLSEIRDVFCFSCVTGLRYSDLKNLKWEHIKGDEIRFTVKKTKEVLTIPLMDYAKEILARYKGCIGPLPVTASKQELISNGNLNYAVKELCMKAEINDPIEIVRFKGNERQEKVHPKHDLVTVHTGRKTFATLSLEKGLSAEVVMALGGWRDYKSFKRYVNITEQSKRVAMLKAWKRPEPLNQLKAV